MEHPPHEVSSRTDYLVRLQGAGVDERGEESALFDLGIFAVNEQTYWSDHGGRGFRLVILALFGSAATQFDGASVRFEGIYLEHEFAGNTHPAGFLHFRNGGKGRSSF